MATRWFWWLAGVACASVCVSCAHSEEEWRQQTRANEVLRAKMEAEQAQMRTLRAERAEASEKLDRLERDLREAGVDPTKLKSNAEERARAIELFRLRQSLAEAARHRLDHLRAKLESSGGATNVVVRSNRITIQVSGDALFDDRDALRPEARAVLRTIADAIRSEPVLAARGYQVVGHVDGPPKGGRFKTAMAWSLARAEQVLAVLVEPADKGGGGLNAARWSAAGRGDGDPTGPGSAGDRAPGGRQANRRCEIVLEPSTEEVLEPAPAGTH
jgi:chemotaxis protein MotB